ncbi:hypothetical protein OQH61_05920 [Helicobacter sp. MIT 21-1697]|uniref:hypothetical protein n=1 Tax=Helicobacter sp. MIT 21-1697 TaxID=2993733 RepID=UPI00224B6EE8|nr:hypothetical protein [Helicobacter sp. MIT 21-1697]MCX2717270.1 hypothetical protein [Helicobacter sp. MIT 21-1697]
MLRQSVIFIALWGIVCVGYVSALNASEDSVKEVMEGYESPQKLFMNLDKTQNDDNKKKSKSVQKIRPQDMKLPLLPQWIYSTGIVETSFTDGSFKRGLGTLLKNGLYLTSSEIIYNGKIMPKKIYVKMQDDISTNMMCVSQLSIKALDLDLGLALLKVSQPVDGYCQVRTKSYYHDRIYKRFGVDIFASYRAITPHTKAYYPYLDNMYVFTPQSLMLEKLATYYDFDKRKKRIYGFEIERDAYEEFTYGRAFYDEKGIFLGIMSRVGIGYLPVFVNRNVIQNFICDVQDKEMIDDSFVNRSCQKLNRQHFFADRADSISF